MKDAKNVTGAHLNPKDLSQCCTFIWMLIINKSLNDSSTSARWYSRLEKARQSSSMLKKTYSTTVHDHWRA